MKVINPLKGKTDRSWFFEQSVYDSDGMIRALKANGGTGNLPESNGTHEIRRMQ